MDFAQHVGCGFGAHWRGILFRQSYKQLSDVVAKTQQWFRQIFPEASYNGSDYRWIWPDGEQLLLRYMDRPDDYWHYHGHEYPWIGWEELTNWPSPDCYDAMKACCRSSRSGMPRKYRGTANPYGPGHNWVKMYWIDPAPAGVPIKNEQGLFRVRIHGTLEENKILLEADPDYELRLQSDTNEARRKAWLEGDWSIVSGGMFDDVWFMVKKKAVIEPFEIPKTWRVDRSFDWGSAKPFSIGWWAESDGTTAPNGATHPRGTLFRIHEWYGWNGQPNEGCRKPTQEIAEGIKEIEGGFSPGVKPGPADTEIFNPNVDGPSIADTMEQNGVKWVKADKSPGSRKLGAERLRHLLTALIPDHVESPGLYIFDSCRHWLRTVPTLPRSERNPEDIDTDAEDHCYDETRYRIMTPRNEVRHVPIRGVYARRI
jgi:hypothetical protein